METTSRIKWILVMFSLLFVLIFVGWGLSSIARSIFSGSSTTSKAEKVLGVSAKDVDTVRLTVDGPVVASKDHRRYTIAVSRRVVSIKLFSDYGQNVISEKSYQNNEESYSNFVQALDNYNVTSRRRNTNVDDDNNEKGVCPTGYRYILELGDDERRWTTSCTFDAVTGGTSGVRLSPIRKLFSKQIPDFVDIVKGTGLNR